MVDYARMGDHIRIYTRDAPGGCRIWQGPVGANGPWFRMGGNSHNARRAVCELAGIALDEGLIPEMTCGNERCLNIDHMQVGGKA